MVVIEKSLSGGILKEDGACPVNKEELIDIRDVLINPNLGKEERIMDFILQIKNPYLFKCGNLVVESVFADTDMTLTDRLQQYFKAT